MGEQARETGPVDPGLLRQVSDMAGLLRANRCGPRILWLIAALVAVISATAYAQILLNAWNQPFYDALTQKDVGAFLRQLRVFAELAGLLLVLNVVQLWLDQTLKLTLRRGLFGALLAAWMTPGRALRLARAGAVGENPDQRMQADVDALADLTGALGIGLFQASLLLVSFIGVLWRQSSVVDIPVAGQTWSIPGFMVWCALFYAAAASWLSWRVGRPLMAMNAERLQREAAFRFELVRINESRDAIALQHGEAAESARIEATFGRLVEIIHAAIRATARLTWVTAGYGWFTIVAPIVAASPFYFSGDMTIGELMLVVGAFNQVQGSLRWFVSNYAVIANWRATLLRVTSFHRALAGLDAEAGGGPRIERHETGSGIEIAGLRVATPYVCVRLDPDRVVVAPGERVLLQGASGSGKTILFRALAGLWDRGGGRIVMPAARSVVYLPTHSYVPPGLLAEAVCYPHPCGRYARAETEAALQAVGLGVFIPRLGTSDRWDRLLSESEKQCLAFARVLLQRPDWLVMDDAVGQLDPDARIRVVKLLKGRLGHMGLLGIGNGSEPDGLYTRRVRIVTDPGEADLCRSGDGRRGPAKPEAV